MLETHLDLYTKARSNLAALADGARSGIDYDAVMLDLDDLHPQVSGTAILAVPDGDRAVIYAAAREAMERLEVFGVHRLGLAVVIAQLDDAWAAETGDLDGAPL